MAKKRSHGEGTIYYDRARKKWVGLTGRTTGDRRRKVSGRTRKEVADQLGKIVHGAEANVDGRMTVGHLLDTWAAKGLDTGNRAPSTVETHQWAVARLKAELGRQPLRNLRPDVIEAALDRMATADGLGRASLVKIRSTLNVACRWAVRRRTLTHNPVAGVEIPHGAPRTVRNLQALTADQAMTLTAHLTVHPLGGLYLLMLGSGLRPGEAAGVCPDALDLEAGLVSVERSVRLVGCYPELVGDLKTAAARRTVHLNPVAVEPLARAADGVAPGDLIYTAPDGGPLWPSTVRAQLTELLAAAGLPAITPNELRHTFATLGAEEHPPHVLADVLGHTSTRMVDATYRHRPRVRPGGINLTAPDNVRHLRSVQ